MESDGSDERRKGHTRAIDSRLLSDIDSATTRACTFLHGQQVFGVRLYPVSNLHALMGECRDMFAYETEYLTNLAEGLGVAAEILDRKSVV